MKYIKLAFLILCTFFIYQHIHTLYNNSEITIPPIQIHLVLFAITINFIASLTTIPIFTASLSLFGFNDVKKNHIIALSFIPPLGKYVPGKILTYSGTLYYLRKIGLPLKEGLFFSFFIMTYNIIITLLLSSLSIPFIDNIDESTIILLSTLSVFFIFFIWYLKFRDYSTNLITLKYRFLLKLTYCILLQKFLSGVSFFYILNSVSELSLPMSFLFEIIIANSIASLSGILAFFSPGGIGVRLAIKLIVIANSTR